jgi:hypothetical protein
MRKIFIVLLLALVLSVPVFAGTDKYNDGSWKITSDGDFYPVLPTTVAIGSSTSYPTFVRCGTSFPTEIIFNGIKKTAWVTTTSIRPGLTAGANLSLAELFTLTPTDSQYETITFTGASTIPGHTATVVVTSTGTSVEILTFSTSLCKTVGTMTISATSGKVRTITLQSDGTNWNEISRTGDM